MKTIIYIISLVIIVTATPISNKRNVDIYWPADAKIPETINRLKKSSGHEVPPLSSHQNVENEDHFLKDDSSETTGEEKTSRQPITIKNASFKSAQEQVAEEGSDNKCQVRFNVCNEQNEQNSKQSPFQEHAERLVSGKKMEDSIKLAKEAMDNLKDDIHKIERTSFNNHADSDANLHTKLEVARQALDHIHENFGNLETLSGGVSPPKKGSISVSDEDKRSALWREMVDNTQKTGGSFKHVDDNTNFNGHQHGEFLATDTMNLVGDHNLKLTEYPKSASDNIKLKSVEATSPPLSNNDMANPANNVKLMDQEFNDAVELTKASENIKAIKPRNQHENVEGNLISEKQSHTKSDKEYHVASVDTKKFHMTPVEKQALINARKHSGRPIKNNQTNIKNIKYHETDALSNNRSTPGSESPKSGSDKSLTPFELPSSEVAHYHDKKIPKSNIDLKKLISPRVNEPHSDFQPTRDEQFKGNVEHGASFQDHIASETSGVPKAAEFNLNQNGPKQEFDVVQNTNQNVEFGSPEHHTFEDLEFMRWANDRRDDLNMPPLFHTASNFQKEHLKSSNFDEHHMTTDMNTHSRHHDLSDHEEHFPFESNVDHMQSMLQMKSPDADSIMQANMPMGIRDAFEKSPMDYSTLQWNHPGMVRAAYGQGGGSASSSSSSTSSGGSSSAVGVFPNANVGGCAIPLLLSCSPSLISGSLAKSASSSSQSGYASSPPSYRNGEEAYFMKRDTKLNEDIPVIKVLRTNTPFNHKHELILDRKMR